MQEFPPRLVRPWLGETHHTSLVVHPVRTTGPNLLLRDLIRSFAGSRCATKLSLSIGAIGAICVSLTIAPGVVGILASVFALVMLAIAVVDWNSFIIPDELNAIGFVVAISIAIAQELNEWTEAVFLAGARGAGLGLLFWGLRWLYAKFRGQQGLGLGDVKLAVVAGAFLDIVMIPVAIELAAVAALAVYGIGKIAGQKISPSTRMPFGVYFAPAIWISWVIANCWSR